MAKAREAVAQMNLASDNWYAATKQLGEEQKYQLALKAQLGALNKKVQSLKKTERNSLPPIRRSTRSPLQLLRPPGLLLEKLPGLLPRRLLRLLGSLPKRLLRLKDSSSKWKRRIRLILSASMLR